MSIKAGSIPIQWGENDLKQLADALKPYLENEPDPPQPVEPPRVLYAYTENGRWDHGIFYLVLDKAFPKIPDGLSVYLDQERIEITSWGVLQKREMGHIVHASIDAEIIPGMGVGFSDAGSMPIHFYSVSDFDGKDKWGGHDAEPVGPNSKINPVLKWESTSSAIYDSTEYRFEDGRINFTIPTKQDDISTRSEIRWISGSPDWPTELVDFDRIDNGDEYICHGKVTLDQILPLEKAEPWLFFQIHSGGPGPLFALRVLAGGDLEILLPESSDRLAGVLNNGTVVEYLLSVSVSNEGSYKFKVRLDGMDWLTYTNALPGADTFEGRQAYWKGGGWYSWRKISNEKRISTHTFIHADGNYADAEWVEKLFFQ